jgi:hypothetical protein
MQSCSLLIIRFRTSRQKAHLPSGNNMPLTPRTPNAPSIRKVQKAGYFKVSTGIRTTEDAYTPIQERKNVTIEHWGLEA